MRYQLLLEVGGDVAPSSQDEKAITEAVMAVMLAFDQVSEIALRAGFKLDVFLLGGPLAWHRAGSGSHIVRGPEAASTGQ